MNHSWHSPAKLNLFLHITGQREDGYHLLQTVFQFLDVGDTLQFETRNDSEVVIADPIPDVSPESDLAYRAATLLRSSVSERRQNANPLPGVTIRRVKRLPLGGGLGGGSSNAATTLVALNELWDCQLERDQLAELGVSLGADVPVFVFGQACWAEGVGDQFSEIDLPEPWYVVLCPPVHVATGEIFSSPDLTRHCSPITIRDFLAGAGRNVCESVVRKLYPPVDASLALLEKFGAKPASESLRWPAIAMTGTGACVFAACESQDKALELLQCCTAEVLPGVDTHCEGFIARGCNWSPLYTLHQ